MSADDHWYLRPLRQVHRSGWELPTHVQDLLRKLSERRHPQETGGLLLGWWEDGLPVALDAVEVPDPAATGTRWTRRRSAADQCLELALAQRDDDVGYIGDWHSHPMNVAPSGRDLRQLRTDSRDFSQALGLAVVRRHGRVDTRLALRGRLTTAWQLRTGE